LSLYITGMQEYEVASARQASSFRAGWALFLDLDGTVLDIAETPQGVEVPPDLVSILMRLSRGLGGALAVLSGRTIADIDRLLAPLALPAAGQHGAELRLAPDRSADRISCSERPREWHARLAALARDHRGILVEDKGIGIAVHYRNAPAAERKVHKALEGLGVERASYALKRGKCVDEIVPRGCDKGRALRRLMAVPPFAGRVPIAIGDDATDEDAFAAALSLGGEALRVASHSASAAFADPRAVRDWLAARAAALAGPERRR